MTTKELNVVLNCLEHVQKPNAFVDEAIAYVRKDLAIRDQQRSDMRDMNKRDWLYEERPW